LKSSIQGEIVDAFSSHSRVSAGCAGTLRAIIGVSRPMDQHIKVIKTGIEEIDSQHQQLVKCLDELQEFSGGSYGFAAVFTVLTTLMEYVRSHFAFEEQFLAKCNYPYLDEHKTNHETLAADVFRLWGEIEAGQNVEEKLVKTIRTWTLDHINAEDIQYAKFFEQASHS
jgi:hemerythrin